MGRFKAKLILALASLALTAVCLTTTTYAWFARNAEAWTDDFELEIENYDDLLISIDGIHFRSSIPNDDLKKAIVSKAYQIDIFSDELTDNRVNELFSAMKFKDVTTRNLSDFYTIDERNKTNGIYNMIKAEPTNYFEFDLYFKIGSHGTNDDVYDLTFVSNKYKGEVTNEGDIQLEDKPNSGVSLPSIGSHRTLVEIHNDFVAGGKSYKAGDKVSIDLRDAVRIGVIHDRSMEGRTIYEPYIGTGSYAIKNGKDIYDPENNLMLKHLESYGGGLKLIDIYQNTYMNTEKDFEAEIPFARFIPVDNKYEPKKITICIWLEGYDSDYLGVVDNPKLSFKLSFRKKEVRLHE